jgi:hypothetical protein
MTPAKTDQHSSSARYPGALRVALAVAVCWAFNACNLNPRPEADSAVAEKPPNMMGGMGGSANPAPEAGGRTNVGAGGGAPAGGPSVPSDAGAGLDKDRDASDGAPLDAGGD